LRVEGTPAFGEDRSLQLLRGGGDGWSIELWLEHFRCSREKIAAAQEYNYAGAVDALRTIETMNLRLVGKRREEVLAEIGRYSAEVRAQLSPAWLELLRNSAEVDAWVHGFGMVDRGSGKVVGSCGFKGPPDGEGIVEIAYGVDEGEQGKGYACEAAGALVKFAFEDERVRMVRAHTMENANASARVLMRCGFRCTGQVTDPDDGLVWRWERGSSDGLSG
jgi:[ribosomal protein S5]-alanine N-acetyltransferase